MEYKEKKVGKPGGTTPFLYSSSVHHDYLSSYNFKEIFFSQSVVQQSRLPPSKILSSSSWNRGDLRSLDGPNILDFLYFLTEVFLCDLSKYSNP